MRIVLPRDTEGDELTKLAKSALARALSLTNAWVTPGSIVSVLIAGRVVRTSGAWNDTNEFFCESTLCKEVN